MLVNPTYGAGGSAPSGDLLPDMSGMKYFYDLTDISGSGDIEVPNALETVAPLLLYGATTGNNSITLTGNNNNSWGYLDTGITGNLTLYTVIKCPSNWGAHIVDFGCSDSRWKVTHTIYADNTTTRIPPELFSGNAIGTVSNVTLRYNYAALALVVNGTNITLLGLGNNGDKTNLIPDIYTSTGSAYNNGKLYLCATQSTTKQSSTANIRMLAIGNTAQSPEAIAQNIGYLSKHYISQYE
jgi:hypothetical protein